MKKLSTIFDVGVYKHAMSLGIHEEGLMPAIYAGLSAPHRHSPGRDQLDHELCCMVADLGRSNLWLSKESRANGLYYLGLALIGSGRVKIDRYEVRRRLMRLCLSELVPAIIRRSYHCDSDFPDLLEVAALRLERDGNDSAAGWALAAVGRRYGELSNSPFYRNAPSYYLADLKIHMLTMMDMLRCAETANATFAAVADGCAATSKTNARLSNTIGKHCNSLAAGEVVLTQAAAILLRLLGELSFPGMALVGDYIPYQSAKPDYNKQIASDIVDHTAKRLREQEEEEYALRCKKSRLDDMRSYNVPRNYVIRRNMW